MIFDLFEFSTPGETELTSSTDGVYYKHTPTRSDVWSISKIKASITKPNTLLLMGMLMGFDEITRGRNALRRLAIKSLDGTVDSREVALTVQRYIPDFKFSMTSGVTIEPGARAFSLQVPNRKVHPERFAEYLMLNIGYYNHVKFGIKTYGKRYEIRDR